MKPNTESSQQRVQDYDADEQKVIDNLWTSFKLLNEGVTSGKSRRLTSIDMADLKASIERLDKD